jgi:predicted O-methyltransferase YrrM
MIDLLNPDKAELLKKWEKELKEVMPLNKWDMPAELAWLAEYGTRCTKLLEHGAYNGASTKIMLLANPTLHIMVVDLWEDGNKGTFDEAMKPFEDRVTVYHASTEEAVKEMRKFYDHIPADSDLARVTKFDGLFIDAGHTKELVMHDIRESVPLMQPGSLICGHDLHAEWECNGIARALEELQLPYVKACESIWAYQMP